MAANRSFTDKKADLETKRKQLADKLARLEAAEREKQRKHETAQRLIVGRVALAHAKDDAAFARMLFSILDTAVTRADERKLIADLVNRDNRTSDKQATTESGEVSPSSEQAGETSEPHA